MPATALCGRVGCSDLKPSAMQQANRDANRPRWRSFWLKMADAMTIINARLSLLVASELRTVDEKVVTRSLLTVTANYRRSSVAMCCLNRTGKSSRDCAAAAVGTLGCKSIDLCLMHQLSGQYIRNNQCLLGLFEEKHFLETGSRPTNDTGQRSPQRQGQKPARERAACIPKQRSPIACADETLKQTVTSCCARWCSSSCAFPDYELHTYPVKPPAGACREIDRACAGACV